MSSSLFNCCIMDPERDRSGEVPMKRYEIQGDQIGDILGGFIGGGGHGGPNVNPNSLNGGMVDVVSGLVGQLAHRFLGVDPATGKIIGAIAGNVHIRQFRGSFLIIDVE
uniref:Uncharacterized protein n=1 Tax=Ascaris lumbricoides TaxID=6252 RepID=A0A0M3ITB5_ASCLU